MSEACDLLVIGGGINGAGIARDAAGRGLSVLLCERGDLAGATSSASSKLIHGGLRYLEHGQFRLVRESLAEREVLLRTAPHLVHPLPLVLPHGPGARPRWLVRAGLFLYDRLGGARSLPASRSLDLRADPAGAPLRAQICAGFLFADCRTDDARLTIAAARDAARRGAEIAPRTEFVSARRQGRVWRVVLRTPEGARREMAARVLVNAAGPWAPDMLARAGVAAHARLRLLKGSHIVVPRLWDGSHGYLLQNDDGRVVFALPFERDFSLIGTTELPFAGDAASARIGEEEAAYLCRAVARWFRAAPRPADIVWSFAGVRPLYDDGARSTAAVSRDYAFELDVAGPPLLTVFGGKLTTFRRLAEQALGRLAPFLPGMGPQWTEAAALPGGEAMPADLAAELARRYPFLAAATAARLADAYGTDARRILGEARRPQDLGRDFGAGLSEAELRWMRDREWARTAEDALWRRSKLGLRLTADQTGAISRFFESAPPAAAGAAEAATPAGAPSSAD